MVSPHVPPHQDNQTDFLARGQISGRGNGKVWVKMKEMKRKKEWVKRKQKKRGTVTRQRSKARKGDTAKRKRKQRR